MWCAGYTQQQSNMPPCKRGGAVAAVRQCGTGAAPGTEQQSSCAQQQLISNSLSWCCHSPVLDIYVCLALFNQHSDLHSESRIEKDHCHNACRRLKGTDGASPDAWPARDHVQRKKSFPSAWRSTPQQVRSQGSTGQGQRLGTHRCEVDLGSCNVQRCSLVIVPSIDVCPSLEEASHQLQVSLQERRSTHWWSAFTPQCRTASALKWQLRLAP